VLELHVTAAVPVYPVAHSTLPRPLTVVAFGTAALKPVLFPEPDVQLLSQPE
jgi:hypothetical protein